jgi:hypothetical protein
VLHSDWAAAVGFFADDVYRPAGERSTEVWIFEADQDEVDELFAVQIDG